MQPNIANPAAHKLGRSIGPVDDPALKALRFEAFDAMCEVAQLDQSAATIHAALHAASMRFALACSHYEGVQALLAGGDCWHMKVNEEATKLKDACIALDAERSRLLTLAREADDLLERAIARKNAAEENARQARLQWIEECARNDAKLAYHDEWKHKKDELAPQLKKAQENRSESEHEMDLVSDDGLLKAQAVAAFDRCETRAIRLRAEHDVAVAGMHARYGGPDAEVNPRTDEPLML